VPEDSVRPETQTLIILIRRKGFVGCFKLIMILPKIKLIKTRIEKEKNQIILKVSVIVIDIKWNIKGASFFSTKRLTLRNEGLGNEKD